MRFLTLALLLTSAAWIAGCSNSTDTLNTTGPISITTSSPGLVHLEAGGLAIRGVGDTAVNFDLVSHVSVKNDSSVALHLLAEWELVSTNSTPPIQVIKPGETRIYNMVAFDSIDLGTVAAGSSVAIDSIPIVTFSDSDLHGGQLDYILQFQIKNGPVLPHDFVTGAPLSTFTDYNISVPFDQRYRGAIYTTEASPTPIAIIDAPDHADWLGDSTFMPIIAYPNPTYKAAQVGFEIREPLDSLRGDLYITPHHILQSFTLKHLQPGDHLAGLDLSAVKPGLYRFVWNAYGAGVLPQTHGNIMVGLP